MIKFGVLCRLSNSLRSECLKHIEKDWIQSFASLIIFISSLCFRDLQHTELSFWGYNQCNDI